VIHQLLRSDRSRSPSHLGGVAVLQTGRCGNRGWFPRIAHLLARRGKNIAAVALANKMYDPKRLCSRYGMRHSSRSPTGRFQPEAEI
jgi:hypothetical protein